MTRYQPQTRERLLDDLAETPNRAVDLQTGGPPAGVAELRQQIEALICRTPELDELPAEYAGLQTQPGSKMRMALRFGKGRALFLDLVARDLQSGDNPQAVFCYNANYALSIAGKAGFGDIIQRACRIEALIDEAGPLKRESVMQNEGLFHALKELEEMGAAAESGVERWLGLPKPAPEKAGFKAELDAAIEQGDFDKVSRLLKA